MLRLRLPLPLLGRLPLLLGQKACLASTANARRALCPRHCKRLGRGLARWQFHALRAWHTLPLPHRPASLPRRLRPYPSAAFDARSFVMSDAAAPYSRLMRLGAHAGSAAALHSRHTTRARPRLASLGLVLPLGLRAWCSVALAARLACKVCGVGCSARSAGRRSTRHRRSTRTSGAGMWDE